MTPPPRPRQRQKARAQRSEPFPHFMPGQGRERAVTRVARQRPGRQPDRRDQAQIDPSVRRQPERRSEEHTSELQSLMRISYAVFCLKKKNNLSADYTCRNTKRAGYIVLL